MMAGLPKSHRWLPLVVVVALLLPCLAAAQVIDASPPIEEQTPSSTLQPLIDVVNISAVATDAQKAELLAAFATSIDAGSLTLDQALAMVALVAWETLADPDDIATAITAIVAVLQGLADGSVVEDPLIALAGLLAVSLTPDGVRNAIARAGGSEDLLAQVDDLVSAGVPPGILVRLTKQSFHDGVDEATIGVLLDELAATADGDAWGQVVNAILDVGLNRHQDREANANENQGVKGGHEEEEEQNQHGNSGKGKK